MFQHQFGFTLTILFSPASKHAPVNWCAEEPSSERSAPAPEIVNSRTIIFHEVCPFDIRAATSARSVQTALVETEQGQALIFLRSVHIESEQFVWSSRSSCSQSTCAPGRLYHIESTRSNNRYNIKSIVFLFQYPGFCSGCSFLLVIGWLLESITRRSASI